MHQMDDDERKIAKAVVDDLLEGDEDIRVPEFSGAKLIVNRTGYSPADENTLRARLMINAAILDTYDIEIVVKRRRT